MQKWLKIAQNGEKWPILQKKIFDFWPKLLKIAKTGAKTAKKWSFLKKKNFLQKMAKNDQILNTF